MAGERKPLARHRIGTQTTIHTHLQQREDGQQLYGFETKADRNLFRLLISVNGVGPQVLWADLRLGAVSLLQAMAAEDVKVLCQAPGVGKRTAERLSLEWRSRLQERWQQQGGTTPLRLVEPVAESRELRATLEALGYGPEEVSAAVAQAGSQGLDPEQPMEEWLRHCRPGSAVKRLENRERYALDYTSWVSPPACPPTPRRTRTDQLPPDPRNRYGVCGSASGDAE